MKFGFSLPLKSLTKQNTPLRLYDTMKGDVEEFSLPQGRKQVRMYNCGPTVYGPAHIGNLRSYVFADVLRRTLEYDGYEVKQVINITDLGHLTSDQDEGEDKMSKGLRREGLDLTLEHMRSLGEKYEGKFREDLAALNIQTAGTQFPRASAYITQQIAMIQTLEEKGYTYRTSDGLYYDTSRFREYGRLGNINTKELKAGARVELNPEKKHPADFNLWKFDSKLGFPSPWGQGFPGWHIECSAMARSCLGEQVDIHTGGIDHIPVHHNNEIAQSEAATGKKPFARFWMHNAFLTIDSEKISKSLGNDIYLDTLKERGLTPLALRYVFLGVHYRKPVNFSWDSLQAGQTSLIRLLAKRLALHAETGAAPTAWKKQFAARVHDDLDTPGALALLWEAVKDSSLSDEELLGIFKEADAVLGLGLAQPSADLKLLAASEFKEAVAIHTLPAAIKSLVEERDAAREKRDFARADQLRDQLVAEGYELEDAASGTKVFKK